MGKFKNAVSWLMCMVLVSAAASLPVHAALDGTVTVTADKTAQWTAQEKDVYNSLRVHGWSSWETAPYIGFTLPDGFDPSALLSAELVVSTESAKNSGKAYIYSADYDSFENGVQYGGTEGSPDYSSAPSYDETEFAYFTSPAASGSFAIDVTDYIAQLGANAVHAAFRIDVKSQNSNNDWHFGSCTSGTAPKLVLEFDDPSIPKTDVTVNITADGQTLRTYSERVKGSEFVLPAELQQHIRRGDTIYYFPSGSETTYTLNGSGAQTINIEFGKKQCENTALFEDFCAGKAELERRGISGDFAAENGKAVLSGGTLNIPSTADGLKLKAECDVTGDITAAGDGVTQSVSSGHLTAEGMITSFTGSGTIDNLTVSIADPVYTGLENGTYTLSASVRRYDLADTAYIYAKTDGAPANRASAAGNDTWRKTVIQGIEVTDGKCAIGISGASQFADITLTKEAAPSRAEFLTGGDITEVSYVESCGGKYYDENGVQADPIQLLAERGFNFARVRIYNDPGKGHGDGEWYLPEGFQNLEDGLSLAKRAKDKGMQIELTLYYSDYWADGSRQLIPNEWAEEIKGLSGDAVITRLGELIYEYTKDVMERMKAQDTVPEYVSLGNEMQGGLLYGPGYDYGRTGTNNFENLAYFLNQGSKAVKEVSPNTKIVLHLDGKMSQYQSFFDNCERTNVNYDVIGPSYYPFWTGNTVDEIVDFYNGLIERYDKDILVMETGYNFNPTKPDGSTGQLADNGPYEGIYESSPDGQRAFMEEVFQGLRSVAGGRCIGDLYWDPMMIYHDGVGWAFSEATDQAGDNVVSNTTLFDFDGKALPAFDAFENNGYTPGKIGIGGTFKTPSGVPASNTAVSININGDDYTVNTDKFGGYFLRVPYSDTVTVTSPAGTGSYSYDMTQKSIATGADFTTESDIEQPLLTDGGFEQNISRTDNWHFPDKGGWYANDTAERTDAQKYGGTYSVYLSGGSVGQRVTLEAGKTYTISAAIKGSGNVRLGLGDGNTEYPASNFVVQQEFSAVESWKVCSVDFNCTETKDYIVIADSWDGSENYVDDIDISEQTNTISLFDASIDGNEVKYTAEYSSDKANAVFYVAAYDSSGLLTGCRVNSESGSFTLPSGGKLTLKAFLWDEMAPLDSAEKTLSVN